MDDNINMNSSVGSGSNSEEFNKICVIVNKQLDKRSNYNDLLGKGIIKNNPVHVSPSLQQLQHQIKFQKTTERLDKKLENRPTYTDLYDHHILENTPLSNLAPSLQSKKKYLQFLQTQSQLLQKLDHRPSPSQLIDSSILKENSIPYSNSNINYYSKSYSSTPPLLIDNSSDIDISDINHHQLLSSPLVTDNNNGNNDNLIDENFEHLEDSLSYLSTPPSLSSSLNSTSSFLSASDLFSMTMGPKYNSFDETIKIMNLKLENRIHHEILIQNGIIKGTLEIAPSIQAAQSLLKFQSISNSIDNKLEKRPIQRDLIKGNIIKNDKQEKSCTLSKQNLDIDNNNNQNNNNSNEINNHSHVNSSYLYNNLNYKIENRPSFEDLVNYNILKDPILYNQKNHLKFIQTRNRLNVKVESRPPIDLLIKNHIIIQNYNNNNNNTINDNNSNDINTKTTKILLQDKLNNRPSIEFLETNHILSPNNEIQFSYDDDEEYEL